MRRGPQRFLHEGSWVEEQAGGMGRQGGAFIGRSLTHNEFRERGGYEFSRSMHAVFLKRDGGRVVNHNALPII